MEDKNNLKNECYQDEIDLVDLLGVIIKRRKFLFSIFLVLFFISSLLMFIKESNFVKNENSKLLETNICLECEYKYVISIDNDYLNYIYNVMNVDYATSINSPKFAFETSYTDFLNKFLFPESFEKIDFLVKDTDENKYFFFNDEDLMNNFIKKYENTNKKLMSSSFYKNKMSDYESVVCVDKMLSKDEFYKPTYNCKMFFYNYNLLKSEFSKAVQRNIVPSVFSYNNILDNATFYKINMLEIEAAIKEIKELNQKNIDENMLKFNVSKFIKYIIIVFILSFIMSIFMVYIYEFYQTNKDRLKEFTK